MKMKSVLAIVAVAMIGVSVAGCETVSNLSTETARELIANCIAVGGMAAKLESAEAALAAGIARVRICDLAGLNDPERGTFITQSQSVVL